MVDEGWRSLILHTGVYAGLCRALHRFVHHVPERPDLSWHDPHALDRTMDRIVDAGYTVDLRLWLPPADDSIPVAASCEHSEPPPAGCGADCSNTGRVRNDKSAIEWCITHSYRHSMDTERAQLTAGATTGTALPIDVVTMNATISVAR